MKFTLVITKDPIIYLPILNRLFEKGGTRIDNLIIVPGISSLKIGKKYMKVASRLFGPAYMLRILYQYLTCGVWSFRKLSKKYGFQLTNALGVNNDIFREILKSNQIQTVISMTPEIYRKETLNIPGIDFYNLHGSILPGNKGILPFFWTCLNDETPGMTVHEIVEKIDDGNIIYQEKLGSPSSNTITSLSDELAEKCHQILLNAMDHIEKKISPVLHNTGIQSSFRGLPTQSDIAAYKKKRKQYIG